jgi:uncharacterized protein
MPSHPKIVADTNVILSGLLFTGSPRKILELALKGRIHLYTSTDLLRELEGVLALKFASHKQAIADTLTEIRNLLYLAEPTQKLSIIKEDPDDDRVLECALSAGVNIIVTGDKDLLRLKQFRQIAILTPAEFLRGI